MKKFPTLYQKDKNSKIRQWTVWADGGVIYTEHGDKGGKLQTSEKKASPKNVGKKNETTAEVQAELEAESLWKLKARGKYFEKISDLDKPLIAPMLAKEYAEKRVKYPCFAQPKLDGVRCLAYWKDGSVYLMSRGYKEWTLMKHIKEELEKILPKKAILDGELYIHGETFQTLTTLIKKERPRTVNIEYHVYDYLPEGDPSVPFDQRLEALEEFSSKFSDKIILTETTTVLDKDVFDMVKGSHLEAGYEGTIIRNASGVYRFKNRSDDLLKVKQFIDEEFLVSDIIEGEGKMEGKAVCICTNDVNDNTFKVTLNLSMDEQAKIYQNRDKYIGKMLTVKYFARTDDELIPKWAKGKAFRPTEDLDK